MDNGTSSSAPPAAGVKRNTIKGMGKGKKAYKKRGPKPKMSKDERRAKYTAIAHDRRDANMARLRDKNLVCYRCRKPGHTAENCKEFSKDSLQGDGKCIPVRKTGGVNICYKCGSIDHRIQDCPKIKPFLPKERKGRQPSRLDFGKLGDLPYANCYICNKSGHLASQCPENSKGLYPKGGSCKECGSVDHYAKDCPGQIKEKDDDDASNASSTSVTIDQYLDEPEPVVEEKKTKSTKKRKVVNF